MRTSIHASLLVASTLGICGTACSSDDADATDTSGADATDTSSADATDTSSADATDTSGADATDTSGADATDTISADATDTSGADADDTSSAGDPCVGHPGTAHAFYSGAWHDVSADIRRTGPPTAVTVEPGELRFCGGEWFALITVQGDATLSGRDGAIVNGGDAGTVVTISGHDVVIHDLKITGGNGLGGGGIQCYAPQGASLRLENVAVEGNRVTGPGYGGGIYASGCTTTIEGGTISRNTSGNLAGGLFIGGDIPTTATLTGVLVEGNVAPSTAGILAANQSTVSLTDTVITGNNTVGYGGGLSLTDSTGTCTATRKGAGGFRGNASSLTGGGVFMQRVNGDVVRFTSDGCDFGATGTADDNTGGDVSLYGGFTAAFGDDATFVCTSAGCE